MVTVYLPKPVYIPADVPIERVVPPAATDPTRPYDRRAVFYDIVVSVDQKSLHCIGPPFLNLGPPRSAYSSGKKLAFSVYEPTQLKTTRVALTTINLPKVRVGEQISLRLVFDHFELDHQFSYDEGMVPGDVDITMSTLQKDNHPQWITDWCVWHHRKHGVGRIVIYDNGSCAFDELKDTLHDVAGPEVILVPWNHPYGRFAAQFPQPAALNHCRLLFARKSSWCINLDIDEYLYNNTNIDLPTLLGLPAFSRHEILPLNSYLVPFLIDGRPARCFDSDIRYRETGNRKYIYQPAKTLSNEIHSAIEAPRTLSLLRRNFLRLGATVLRKTPRLKSAVHRMLARPVYFLGQHRHARFLGLQKEVRVPDPNRDLFFFHFLALNTGWMNPRRIVEVDESDVVVDSRIKAMKNTIVPPADER